MLYVQKAQLGQSPSKSEVQAEIVSQRTGEASDASKHVSAWAYSEEWSASIAYMYMPSGDNK